MSQVEEEKKAKKEAMKQLRAARKEQIAEASGKMKKQKKDIEAIKEKMYLRSPKQRGFLHPRCSGISPP